MIKTVNLTANSELAVDITGSHCKIKNRGTSTVYASRLSGVSAGADEVISIDGGTADVLRNVGQYGVKNGTYDCTGKLYLLSDAACTVEIQTASDLCFFKSGGSGGGGTVPASSSCIVCSLTQPEIPDGLWIQYENSNNLPIKFACYKSDLDKNIQIKLSDFGYYEQWTYQSVIKNGNKLSYSKIASSTTTTSATYSTSVEIAIFDLETKTISKKTNQINYFPCHYYPTVACGEYVYTFGGGHANYSGVYNNFIFKYDSEGNVSLCNARTNSANCIGAANVNGMIYLFGGGNGKTTYKSCYKYDPETDTITSVSSNANIQGGVVAESIGEIIYVAGGDYYSSSTSEWKYLKELLAYDTSTGVSTIKISNATQIPSNPRRKILKTDDDKLFILDTNNIYDPETNTFTLNSYSANFDAKTEGICYLYKYNDVDFVVTTGDKIYYYDEQHRKNKYDLCSGIYIQCDNSDDTLPLILCGDEYRPIKKISAIPDGQTINFYKIANNNVV